MTEINYRDIISQYNNPTLIYEGGQRIVFKADHPEFGKIALKIGHYRSPQIPDGWDIARIEREIEILKQINSEYYPKNFNFEKLSDGRYIIVEEFIDSTPLSHCMERFQSPSTIMNLTKKMVTGLNVIWERNIVHRDLKPENILITPNGSPKIIDLGIARSLDRTSITQPLSAGPCTPAYAAPELLIYNKKRIDKRTDQYSVGIILVQMLLRGKHPFDPEIVGGVSIPQNILADNWYKAIFDKKEYSSIAPIAKKLLGFQQFQRYRTYEMLLAEINNWTEGQK